MRHPLSYRIDLAASGLKRSARAVLPQSLLRSWGARRQEGRRARAALQLIAGDAYPWTSPNIWNEIVRFYKSLEKPRLLEFGMGASTLWHARDLNQRGGARYTGVESSPDWFWTVVAAVLRQFQDQIHHIAVSESARPATTTANPSVQIELASLVLDLRLRPELPGYLDALASPHDVVVVDGIARKSCVQAILANPPFTRQGLLMLMEAGRGREDWWEGLLSEDDDYRPEVSLITSMGGELLDGDGLDTWPGCRRKSPRPVSYDYPREACRLLVSGRE